MRRVTVLSAAIVIAVIGSSSVGSAAPPVPSIDHVTASLSGGPVIENGSTYCMYIADVTITFKGKFDVRVQFGNGAPPDKVVVTGSGTETVTIQNIWAPAGTSGRFVATAVKQHLGVVTTAQSDPVNVAAGCTS